MEAGAPPAGVGVDYCRLMARYNRWMNERLYAALGGLDDAERKRDRGAFFGSIHRTLCHVVWADGAWLARFAGTPYTSPPYGADLTDDYADLRARRDATDLALLNWAGRLEAAWLASTLTYRRASDGAPRRMPAWVAAAHLFQHATHHRAQVGTLMHQAGLAPGVTDLAALPGVVR